MGGVRSCHVVIGDIRPNCHVVIGDVRPCHVVVGDVRPCHVVMGDVRYESTGPEFHYECHKNTELQKSHQKWEDTLRKWEGVKSMTDLGKSAEKMMICV
ncbi:hypothetical protein FSP39_023839 [Pinctada imbricata]|uniref:Uncharacterized protein n=1 Tax=Pinctada imbricata TaxID=66713 RepID=A0AA88YGJ0_PINIB|nr:hypothetical protein FSP39_023839 [Pinctada imbricata]